MKTVKAAFLIVLACAACKDKETSPIYTIVGTYGATNYRDGLDGPVAYPIAGHNMSVKVVSETDSTVNVEIVSTPPNGALPAKVYVPASTIYRNVLSIKEGSPTKATFLVNLTPVFGQPGVLANAILFYSGTNFADYYYTPAETPTITKTIRLVRIDQ